MGLQPMQVTRLKKRSEFLATAATGIKAVRPTMVLQAGKRPSSEMGVGFTTTRKLGGAVIRNRIRRRLRAAADKICPVQGMPGMNLVIIGRQEALKADFKKILGDLESGLKILTKQLKASHPKSDTVTPKP